MKFSIVKIETPNWKYLSHITTQYRNSVMEVDTDLLPCPLCKLPFFEDVHSLRSTLINVATTHLICPVCNESVMGLDKLTIHLFSHIDCININAKKHSHEWNEKLSKDQSELVDLEKSNSQTVSAEATTVVCDICDFTFTDQTILELHQKLLHQTSPDKETGIYHFHCHLCTKKFKMRGSLIVHLRVAHYGFSKSSVQKGMAESGSVTTKPITKIGDCKQWECDICYKMFTTKYFLKKHKRLHTGEMPYACSQCNKSFTFQQSYHKHMLYHSSEKPHTCTECGRSFKEISTLQNHVRIHSGERPFSCETCGKCFRQRVSYLVHRRIHTGVMPYECNGCGKKFRYKVSQRSHKCIVPTKNNESAIHHQSQTEVNSHSSVEQNKTIFHMKDTPICKKKDPQKNFNSNTNDYQCFLNYTTKNTQKTGLGDFSRKIPNFNYHLENVEDSATLPEFHAKFNVPTEVSSSTPDLYSMILSPLLPDVDSLCLSNSSELQFTQNSSTEGVPNETIHNTENIFNNPDFSQRN